MIHSRKLNLEDFKMSIEHYREEQSILRNLHISIDERRDGYAVVSYSGVKIYDDYVGGDVLDSNNNLIGEIINIDVNSNNMTIYIEEQNLPNNIKIKKPDFLEKLNDKIQQENSYYSEFENLEGFVNGLTTRTRRLTFPSLRRQQEIAFKNSLNEMLFIWGPPGTGKTYTTGAIAARHLEKNKKVLLLGTSNTAVDTALIAVDNACQTLGINNKNENNENYKKLLRLGYTVKDELLERRHVAQFIMILENYTKDLIELKRKLKSENDRIQKAKFKDEINNLNSEINNIKKEFVEESSLIATTFHSYIINFDKLLKNKEFDTLIIDEASMVPLASIYFIWLTGNFKHIIISGDPKQLAPVNTFNNEFHEREIERRERVDTWFGANIYDYLELNDFKRRERWFNDNKVIFLNEQSRMNEEICNIVSNAFYDGKLITIGVHNLLQWNNGNDIKPLNFICYDDGNTNLTIDLSNFIDRLDKIRRIESLKKVVLLLIKLYKNLTNEKILVITPFRDQLSALTKVCDYLQEMELIPRNANMRVSTIHRVQGDEADIVIFDVAEALNHFLRGFDAQSLWNVAFSRTQKALFVISNNEERSRNEHFKKLFTETADCLNLN